MTVAGGKILQNQQATRWRLAKARRDSVRGGGVPGGIIGAGIFGAEASVAGPGGIADHERLKCEEAGKPLRT